MIKNYFMTGLASLLPLVLTIWLSVWFIKFITRPFESVASTWVALTFLIGIILLTGFLAERFFLRYWFGLLKRMPLVGSLYKSFSDVTEMVLSPKGPSFTKVVWVPFWEDRQVIGLVAHDDGELVSVFVPGAFNSAFGFVILVERENLIGAGLSVEEAVKYQVSCGMVDLMSREPIQYCEVKILSMDRCLI